VTPPPEVEREQIRRPPVLFSVEQHQRAIDALVAGMKDRSKLYLAAEHALRILEGKR
jgi:hypothetical protein